MYTIILLSILTIVGFVGGWLIDKYTYADGWAFGFYGTGTLCAVALACFLCALINIDRRIQNTVYKYEYISRMSAVFVGCIGKFSKHGQGKNFLSLEYFCFFRHFIPVDNVSPVTIAVRHVA